MPARPRLAVSALAVSIVSATLLLGAGSPATGADPDPSPATETGTLVRVIADGASDSHESYALNRGPGLITPLTGLAEAEAAPLLGEAVAVHGSRDGQTGDLDVDRVAPMAEGQAAADQTAPVPDAPAGTLRVGVLMVNFANDTRTPATAQQLRTLVFDGTSSVNAYYNSVTAGATTLTGDVHGYYTLPAASGCDYSTWSQQATAAATADGVNLNDYDVVITYWPTQACGWSGLGYLGAYGAWINGVTTLRTWAHELGHNFGAHHANAWWKCTSTATGAPVTWQGPGVSCTNLSYADPYTVMGAGSTERHVGAQLDDLGLVTPRLVTEAQATIMLAPAYATSGVRLIRVPRTSGETIALSYRDAVATFDPFSVGSPVRTGVSIHLEYGHLQEVRLLDATPETSSLSDAPLAAGRSLTDPVSGVTITVGTPTGTGIPVTIDQTPDTQAPTAPTALESSAEPDGMLRTGRNGTADPVFLYWTDGADGIGVTGTVVDRNGVRIAGPADLGGFFEDRRLPVGTYRYRVRHVDASGNLSPAASTTVAVTDGTRPSAVPTLTAKVLNPRKPALRKIRLTWSAATDNVAVTGYVIRRNGTVLARTGPGVRSVTKPLRAKGSSTFAVHAVDAAGNTAKAATVRVTVR